MRKKDGHNFKVKSLLCHQSVALKRAVCMKMERRCHVHPKFDSDEGRRGSLTSESVQGSSLSLESIDDIHGSHGLPLGMFSVGDSISDDILQEDLEDSSGFFVDQSRDSFHSSSSCQSSDGGLGDSLDVISKNLSMSLCSSFSETLSSFSSSRHCCSW